MFKKLLFIGFIAVVVCSMGIGLTGCKKEGATKKAGDEKKEVVRALTDDDKRVAAEASKDPRAKTAIEIVKKFAAYMKVNGKEKSIKVVGNPKDPDYKKFISGDYYLWIIETDFKESAIVVVHAINKAINGKQWYAVKDPNGIFFVKDIVRICQIQPNGWVEYSWTHPKLKKTGLKLTYFERVDNIIINCGFYK